MKLIRKRFIVMYLGLVIVAFGSGYTYSEIASHRLDDLKIAFTNGYLAATKLSLEELSQLKEDEGLLRAKVTAAADEYAEVVKSLNPQSS